MMEEDHTYDPYTANKYPVIHTQEVEDCSSLDCTMDEEAVHGSWAAVIADDASNHGQVESATRRERFGNTSRRVNGSSRAKKCLFYGGVFVALSAVGLAGVGLGMVLLNGGYFTKDVDEEVSAVEEQVERTSEDEFIEQLSSRISPGAAPASTTAPTYIFNTPYPTVITEVWATEPSSTTTFVTTDIIALDSIQTDEFDEMTVPQGLEMSMSMDINDSMYFDDFDHFGADFDGSMSIDMDESLEVVGINRISPASAPTQSTTAPTYIFSTPYPTVSNNDAIVLDEVNNPLELSMSMNFDVDNMSMFFEDFEQFDVDFESMSMTHDDSNGANIDDAVLADAILQDTTTDATAVDTDEAEVTTEPSTDIVIDEVEIVSLASKTDSTEISLEATTPVVATKPFVDRDCAEDLCIVELSADLTMEYKVIVPENTSVDQCDGCALQVKMTYDGIAWLGLGFSDNGAMTGSEAVIGVPIQGGKATPQKYILGGQSVDSVQPMPAERQTLQNASIKIGRTSDGIKTVMKFTKLLVETGEIQVSTGANTLLWAHGLDETLAYHAERSSFPLDLSTGQTLDSIPSTPMATDATGAAISVDETELMATEGTIPSSTAVTEGTIAAGAFDIDVTGTEPTTQVMNIIDGENETESVTPTYYPTVSSELITEILAPVADTFVEFNSSKAFGMRQWTKVDGKPERITLIRFDLSSLVRNKAVELFSAKLRLFALTSSPFGGKVDIIDEDICGEWDENFVTWTSAPPGVFATPPESLGSFGPSEEFQWNEAELTLKLLSLPLQFTIKITSDRDNGVTYATKENITAVPELVLEYMGWPYEDTDVPTMTPTETALIPAAVELTDSPTESPVTSSPTLPPVEPIVIEVRRDAMLRNGQYSDKRFGYDSTIAMKSHDNPNYTGKSIVQFDISDVPMGYNYELKLFITYTGSDDERTLSIFGITDTFRWGEDWITWNRLGNPDVEFLGSAVVGRRDVGSYVSFSLGQLKAVDGRANLIIDITSGQSDGSKVDYKAREAGSDPPILIASP